MANAKIRGITIDIGADTSGFSKALGSLNSDINNTSKQLKDVNRLLKLDPTNTELLAQKQKLLAKQVSDTKTKLDTLKDAQKKASDEMKNGNTKAAESYDAITREIVSVTAELKELEKQQSNTSVAFQQFQAGLGEISKKADEVANKTRGISTAAAGLAAAFIGNAVNAAAMADDLNTLSKQTGFTTAELQKMQYASDLIDVSMDTMTGSITKLTNNMASNSGAFETLGVSITNADGSMRNATDVWYDSLEALSQVENATLRDQLATELFGRSSRELTGVIDDGGAALKQLGQEAEDAGLIMSQDALDSANEFNDGLDKLKATAQQTFMQAGATLAEALLPMLEKLVQKVSEVLTWFSNLDGDTQTLILTILGLVAAISPVAKLIGGVSTAIGFLTSPVGLAVVAIGGLIAIGVALYKNWDKIKEKASEIWGSIKDSVKKALDAIKLPHFSITGSFSIIPPRVPKLNIDWYAKAMQNGMILDSPTIFGMMNGQLLGGGEAGSEAVVGTSSLMNMIREAASSANSGGDQTFNVNVNASFEHADNQSIHDLAEQVADAIQSQITMRKAVW